SASGQGVMSPPKLKSWPSARSTTARAALPAIAAVASASSSAICSSIRFCGGLSSVSVATPPSKEYVRCGMTEPRFRLGQVLAEPRAGGPAGLGEVREIGLEVTARNELQSLRFERALIGGEGQVGDRDRVVERDHHQQRRGRDAADPATGFVHPRGAGRAEGDGV